MSFVPEIDPAYARGMASNPPRAQPSTSLSAKPFAKPSGSRESANRSVDRTLDVLELLASRREPMGVTRIAAALGTSTTAAHRLLGALLARDYVRQDAVGGGYSIGLQCFALATLASANLDARTAAAPHLRRLNELTGETAHLAVYNRGEVVYIDRLESAKPVAPVSRIGARAPAHCVATGRAILAYLPPAHIDELLEQGLESFNEQTPATREELEADFAATRRRGYAVNDGAWRLEVCGVAAPVRDFSGTVRAALGCCLPSSRFTEPLRKSLIAHTLDAAARASAELGFVVPSAEEDA
jgi:IclR family KDG regulon transcriptional repressor